MWQDPFTLVVALSKEGEAEGQVYLDDGVGYGYERGEYIWRGLRFSPAEAGEGGQGKSTSKGKGRGKGKDKGKGKGQKVGRGVLASFNKLLEEGVGVAEQNAWAQAIAHVRVEKIVILGVGEKPKGVMLRGGEELEWTYEQGVGAGGKEEGKGGRVVIKSPGVRVVEGWEIEVV
jgi:alpha 1,3-glucosidase